MADPALLETLLAIKRGAARLQNAVGAVDAAKDVCRLQTDSHPSGNTPEALLAYHAAWCELTAARAAFVAIVPPIQAAVWEIGQESDPERPA